MKLSKLSKFTWYVLTACCLFVPQTGFSQTEKLGPTKFTPPRGWTRSVGESAVTFSEIDQKAGKFCTITLHAPTSSSGNPQTDFAREWNRLAVGPFGAAPSPETATQLDKGWTVIGGGAPIDVQGTKAIAALSVFSGFGKTVSVMSLLNDNSYLPVLQAFAEGMEIDKTNAAPTATAAVAAPPQIENGRLVIPLPTRQLTVADLVGQWGQNDGINTRYVDRYTGTYAGFESLHFTNKMTITAGGGFTNDFFAIQNGRKIKEDTSGTVAINGRMLIIRQRNIAKYVIRGWLELPDMTILEICGPWYGDDVIPAEIFNNPDQGANLNAKWVRKK